MFDKASEVSRIRGMVYRTKLVPQRDVEDVAQDILVEALEKQQTPGFLWVRRRCLDYIRSKVRRRKHEELAVHERQWHVNPPNGDVTSVLDLNDLMKEADVEILDKRILWLRYYQGLTLEQIGTSVGVSTSKVETSLKSTLFKLRSVIDARRCQ